MSKPPQPVFLERQGYRRRRLSDAARMLPVFGAALLLVPLMWPRPEATPATGTEVQGIAMSNAILYVFSVWALLVVLTALFGLSVRRWGGSDGAQGQGRG